MLAVVGINIGREQALDGTCEASVETVDEDGFEDGSLEQHVGFSCRRVGRVSGCGGRSFCFLLSILGRFRGIGLHRWERRGARHRRNWVWLRLFQKLSYLSRIRP